MRKILISTDKPIQEMETSLYQVNDLPKEEWVPGEYVYCARTLCCWGSAKVLMDEVVKQCKIYNVRIRKMEVTESADPHNEILP